MDEFRRAALVVLFPLAVIFSGLMFGVIINSTPASTLYMDLSFGQGHVNISESWIIPTLGESSVYRRLPHGGPFEDMSIKAVSCSGQAFIEFDGSYMVTCSGTEGDTAILGVAYELSDPYACYDDMCYFSANFFDKAVVNLVELRFFGISDQTTFPDLQFVENRGTYSGNPSTLMVSESLPTRYSGDRRAGTFQNQFDALKTKHRLYTKLESDWLANLLVIVSFESFVAFILYLVMGMEKDVKSSGQVPVAPSKRPIYEVARLFFRDVGEESIIGATILDLASRGYIDITGRHMKIVRRKSNNLFEDRILDILSAVSEKGKVFLSEDWLRVRIAEIGTDVFDELLKEVYDSMVIPRKLVRHIYDPLGSKLIVGMQLLFASLPVLTYLLLPAYLINFRLSMFLLGIMNAFWVVLTLRIGSTAFGRYSVKGATEKALWLSFKRFARSRMAIEQSEKVDWDYLLAFASMFDLEDNVINAAEVRHKYFRNIRHPRSATHIFDLIVRSARQIEA